MIRSLLESILSRPAGASPKQIILWWETLRLPYNLIVGASGLVTLATGIALFTIVPLIQGDTPDLPDMAIIWLIFCAIYGVMANAIYTLGWVLELVAGRILKRDLTIHAQSSFVVGTIFSVAITLLPAIFYIVIATLTLILNPRMPGQ